MVEEKSKMDFLRKKIPRNFINFFIYNLPSALVSQFKELEQRKHDMSTNYAKCVSAKD